MRSILHISDLHYSSTNKDQSVFIRDALLADLTALFASESRPNVLIFSGDLVNDPDEPDVYLSLIEKFIEPISAVTGVAVSDMVFCPGNHDVSFKALKQRSIERSGLLTAASDPRLLSATYSQAKLDEYATSLSAPFIEFTRYLDNPWENPFYKVYPTSEGNIIALNAAFSCSEKGSKEDRGKLFFPESAWDRAHDECGPSVMATVVHFPLTDLAEAYARQLQPKIHAASELLCFGHLHDPTPANISGVSGSFLGLQSGALYEKDERFKGYALIQTDVGQTRAKFRTFYGNRRQFDVATNVASDGVFYPTPAAEAYWKGQKPTFTNEQLCDHLELTVAPEIENEFGITLDGEKLADVFVPPSFGEADKTQTDENGDAREKIRTTDDIFKNDEHICFVFPDETGATSFLSYLSLVHAKEPSRLVRPRIPIQVDLRSVTATYQPAVEKVIKAAFPCVDHIQFGWKARNSDSPFVFLVDNYDDRKDEHVTWLRQANTLCPGARFLVCAKSPFAGIHHLRASVNLKVPFGHRRWNLYPLDRVQVRRMVNRFQLPENINRNQVVEEILSKFKAIGIPLSGPIVSMYLSVIKDQKKYSPVNTSAVLENFIEISLEKRQSSVVFQDDFDYREQLNLLSVLSEFFIDSDVDNISLESCYNVISGHYKSTGVNRNSHGIIQYFCEKGILENVANNIYFKYGMIFSYLVAHRMATNRDFREKVLLPGNIHKFIAEIDIYFGINRDDTDALGKISNRYKELLAEVEADFGSFLDAKSAAKLELPRAEKFEDFVTEVSERIIDQVEGHEDFDRDRAVQPHSDTPSQFIQKFKRAETQDSLIEWMKVLACYSVCIKNSENFSLDVKKEHALVIVEGWEKLIALGVRVIGLLISDGSMEVGDRKFEFRAKSIKDPKIMRGIVASVPRFVSYYANLYLSSGKLESTLKSLNVDGFASFLRVSLLVDMRVDAFLKEVEGYRRANATNPTLLESMMWKLRDSFMRFGLDKGYIQSFQRAIVEIHADILGLKGETRAHRVAEMLKRLSSIRLLRNIKSPD